MDMIDIMSYMILHVSTPVSQMILILPSIAIPEGQCFFWRRLAHEATGKLPGNCGNLHKDAQIRLATYAGSTASNHEGDTPKPRAASPPGCLDLSSKMKETMHR